MHWADIRRSEPRITDRQALYRISEKPSEFVCDGLVNDDALN
jgi:hypothetical protein